MTILATFLNFAFNVLTFAVVVYAFTSFFLQPYHPIRRMLSFVETLLNPIRRVLPPIAGLDFSPLVLILLIQLIQTLIVNFLVRFR